MRGHWISNTRKLNRHYQSARKRLLPYPYTYPLVTPYNSIKRVYEFLYGSFIGTRYYMCAASYNPSNPAQIMPSIMEYGRKFAVHLYLEYNGISPANCYLMGLTFQVIYKDKLGTDHQRTVDFTNILRLSSFIEWDGRTVQGERFVYDADTGLYKTQSTFVIDADQIDPANFLKWNQVRVYYPYSLISSEALPSTAPVPRGVVLSFVTEVL